MTARKYRDQVTPKTGGIFCMGVEPDYWCATSYKVDFDNMKITLYPSDCRGMPLGLEDFDVPFRVTWNKWVGPTWDIERQYIEIPKPHGYDL